MAFGTKILRSFPRHSLPYGFVRTMATVHSSLPHIERTAAEPRDDSLHPVILSEINQINSAIRLFQLKPVNKTSIKFRPGQWLDLHIPSLPSPGGFTITSSPSLSEKYIELAVQKSPASAAPASWLWQHPSKILNTPLAIRVGGSFTFPPPPIAAPLSSLRRVVFIAGGVGINPLMSMLSSIAEQKALNGRLDFNVHLLYSTRVVEGEEILFLSRLRALCESLGEGSSFQLFVTGSGGGKKESGEDEVRGVEGLHIQRRRIEQADVEGVLGKVEERDGAVAYVCGVRGMTDQFVEMVGGMEGMSERRVLSEKWW